MTTATAEGSRDRRLTAWPRAAVVPALLVLEIFVGQASVHFAPSGTHISAFWPNAGISVLALTLTAARWRPAVLAGIYVVSVLANYLGGRELDLSLALGFASVAEAAVVIWLLTRGGHERPVLQCLEDFIRLLVAVAAGALTCALIGGVVVSTVGSGDLWVVFRAMAASHGAALLLMAPLSMSLVRHNRWNARPLEAGVQWALLIVAVSLVYAPGQHLPLLFLPFPLLVWGAARLSPRETTLQLLVVATIGSILTLAGHGPLVYQVTADGLPPEMIGTLLQANLVAAALVALPLSLVKTQRLIALDRVTRSHELVNSILDSTTGTAIVGLDVESRIEFFNIGAERLTGYRAEDLVGKARVVLTPDEAGEHVIRFVPEDQVPANRVERLFDPMFEAGEKHVTVDLPWMRRGGDVRMVQVTVSPRYGDDGQSIGYLGVAEDVTERRRHEAMVEAALEAEKQIVERLAQVDQTKNDFLSTASHELRTPITSILGYSQLLLSDDSGTLPAMHHQIVGRIERNGRRLMGLIEDMLMMSQVEVGNFHFERAPMDLREAVQAALESVHGNLLVNRVIVEQDLGPHPVTVWGDFDKLERVFTNLLSNAAKFSHPGDTIVAALSTEADEAVFTVTDSGLGISLEEQAHLFDPFFRGADAHALAIQGVGLGLPIASSLVAGHDGRIDVISELGKGSTFVVRLPLLEASGADRPGSASAAPAVGGQRAVG